MLDFLAFLFLVLAEVHVMPLPDSCSRQSRPVLEGDGVAFLEDPMTLGLAPRLAHIFQTWCSLAPTGRFRATVWTFVAGWTEGN